MIVSAEMLPAVLEKVRGKLKNLEQEEGVPLAVEEHDYKIEDDWLYICITPTKSGVRASDYARTMARVERELYEEDIENVLLVPTLDEH